MTLRKKTGFIIGITVVLLISVLLIASRIIFGSGLKAIERQFMNGFLDLEHDETNRNMQRVENAFREQRIYLRVKATDWAQWDDAYRFAADRNRAFVESNISVDGLELLRINLLAMVQPDGETIYALAEERGRAVEVDCAALLVRYPKLQKGDDTGDSCGIVMVNGRPMIVASLPIVKTDGTGPVRGAVLFGRYVDDSFFRELASITNFNLRWKLLNDSSGMQDTSARTGNHLITMAITDTTITGTTMLHDLSGKPAIELSVTMSRDVYRHGKSGLADIHRHGRLTMMTLVFSIFMTGIVLCFVIFIILERYVLRRVKQLARKSEAIGNAGTASARLPVEGTDEIASLATSINTMLEALQQSHDAIADRDREKRMLMNNVPIGLFSLNPSFLINPEHSRSLSAMFGAESCTGRHINDLLALHGENEEAGSDLIAYLDLVKRRMLPEKEVSALNPLHELHFTSRGIDAWYSLQFYAIDHADATEPHILVTVVDCTDEKLLNVEMDEMHRENLQLKRIAENPDFFMEFMLETRDIITNLNKYTAELVPEARALVQVVALFRGIHTIKGVAGSFGLKKLEEVTGNGETILSAVIDDQTVDIKDIENVRQLVAAIAECFDEVVALSNAMLGDVFDGEGVSVRIPLVAIDNEIAAVKMHFGTVSREPPDAAASERYMVKLLQRMKMMPAGRALARSLRMVPSLAARLGKQCRITLSDPSVRIDYEKAKILNVVLVHLLRNAVDHGIENSEERITSGKEPEGVITLSLTERENEHVITIADDGRGLDEACIKAAAIDQGFFTREQVDKMTVLDVYHLIFRSGLTTTEQLTEISGRGVGLDTVLTVVREELKGTITVDSRPGQGTVFTILVPL